MAKNEANNRVWQGIHWQFFDRNNAQSLNLIHCFDFERTSTISLRLGRFFRFLQILTNEDWLSSWHTRTDYPLDKLGLRPSNAKANARCALRTRRQTRAPSRGPSPRSNSKFDDLSRLNKWFDFQVLHWTLSWQCNLSPATCRSSKHAPILMWCIIKVDAVSAVPACDEPLDGIDHNMGDFR